MSNSIRYFQLTPEILLEYKYASQENAAEQEGNVEYLYDLWENNKILVSVVEDKYNATNNFLYSGDSKYETGFVLPTNTSESKFIQCISTNKSVWESELRNNIKKTSISGVATENTSDILFDKLRFHFTSKNYMGSYDGLIIRATIYDKKKNKISLFSHYIRRTDNVEINENPMLINQKLYTTYMDFEIPSTYGLLNTEICDLLKGEEIVRKSLLLYSNVDIMENTPMVFSVYGVKSTAEVHNLEYYTTEKLNSIYVPIQDEKTGDIEIVIKEPDNGDYFEIYPTVNNGYVSFSDFINDISNDRPDIYIVFHELTLIEHYTNNQNVVEDKITHREQYIVNGAESNTGKINEDELEEHMIYRPVILNSGKIVKFTITDTMRILNTLDNTTIVKTGSCDYGLNSGENPKKYGKTLNCIPVDEKSIIKVYNKTPDIDIDSVKITNGGSNVTIENHQHSVTGFIESINVGVSIEQIAKEDLE